MKIKYLLFVICVASLFLVSCNSNNDLTNNSTSDLKTGGTLKMTFPSGNSYNYFLTSQYNQYNNVDNGHWNSNMFTSLVNEPSSGNDNSYSVLLAEGSVEVTQHCPFSLWFLLPPPIEIGKEYCFKAGGGAHFFVGLVPEYNESETITVKLSAFKCPGRITGVEIKYDKAGKVLLKGEFDFISHLN